MMNDSAQNHARILRNDFFFALGQFEIGPIYFLNIDAFFVYRTVYIACYFCNN